MFIKTDVINAPDIEARVAKTVERFGRLDCAFNNAGIGGPAGVPVAEITESSWDQVMNINLKAVWLCMKYEIPAMLEHGKGAIVNNSSVYGYKPSDVAHAPYATSKFGVIGLSKSAAVDYGQKGIRINVVSPGYVHSELVDPYVEAVPDVMKALVSRYSAMNRLGEGHEIAAGVAWLCSDAASFVNGAVLAMDGATQRGCIEAECAARPVRVPCGSLFARLSTLLIARQGRSALHGLRVCGSTRIRLRQEASFR